MPKQKKKTPVWKGPEEDGITFSLLSRFLVCRERFRLLVVEGLKPKDQFNHKLEYGQMWQICEEELAATREFTGEPLRAYYGALVDQYVHSPNDCEHINKWYNVCKSQFPIYIDYWSKHKDVTSRTPLLQEESFCVPYKLSSGRTVRLRGKWDSVDLIGKGRRAGIYLQENKTKGDINEGRIKSQLAFDLQTMMYLIALDTEQSNLLKSTVGSRVIEPDFKKRQIKGVRYNVVRRPLSGGRHSIKQKKNQTQKEFYEELAERIKEEPEFFFMRWKVEISQQDIDTFKRECLDPLLENLCNWWSWVKKNIAYSPFRRNMVTEEAGNGLHWRTPFGTYDVLREGGSHDLDEFLATGSEIGLQRTDNLFPELD